MTKVAVDANIALVLEAFDKRVFVRNIEGDGDPMWGIKLIPYLMALKGLGEYIKGELKAGGDAR
jgi:hypothetical protein